MESSRRINTDGYPMVDLDSEKDESCSSSEDEIDVLLSGAIQRKFRDKTHDTQSSSSEDEFEKEMAAELNQRMVSIGHPQQEEKNEVSGKTRKTPQQRYEDEFLDSIDRSDDEETTNPHTVKVEGAEEAINDDLLYDPDMDDNDQKWVDKQRQLCQPRDEAKASKQSSTDAVLCCPACMGCLCRDCQRHTVYKNQFRAMFVTNCSVDRSEVLRYPTQESNKKGKKKRAKSGEGEGEEGSEEPYHPVKCTQCSTEVGVFDSEEIFHFFNVIESNG